MIVLPYKQGDTITLINNNDGTAIHLAIGRETAKGTRIAIQAQSHVELHRDTPQARECLGESFK